MKKQIGALAGVFVLAVAVGYWILRPGRTLPVLQPRDVNPALVDEEVKYREDHHILPFSLVNQLGDTVGLADVKGQILIVDFFFTRCPTICPVMTRNLVAVQEAFSGDPDVRILSHSVTPVADSVSVMAAYGQKFGIHPQQWWLLTGEKKEIYRLARKSYFTCLDEGDGGLQDFIHTENVALVDGKGRLRGFYDGTDQTAVDQLVVDVRLLLEKKKLRK